jgi:hypothetical protein
MTGRSGNNIWCISPMFDLNKPTILLNSHIDTVKPVNGWRKHPFTPKAENGKIYGLGSNDAGASNSQQNRGKVLLLRKAKFPLKSESIFAADLHWRPVRA